MAGTPPLVDDEVASSVPLCVELKRGVLVSDYALEALLSLLKSQPAKVLPAALAGKRVSLRAAVTRDASLDVRFLRYNEPVLRHLREERERGRRIVLVANADETYAHDVAGYLDCFDDVLMRVADVRKGAVALEARFGAGRFEYLEAGSSAEGTSAAAQPRPNVRVLLRALRPHQWLKNALVILPVLAGQQLTNLPIVGRALLAFIAFSLAASFVYVVNDLLDLQEDRRHPTKRERPFASGRLPLSWAPGMMMGLLIPALAISAFLLPPSFSLWLFAYLGLTFAYSVKLKSAALIDVFTLAGLYTLRVIAGSAATGIEPSVWLLGFCMFFFLSLAMVKRYAELHALIASRGSRQRLPGRSYERRDLPVLVALGIGTGCMSVLVLALYIISDEFASHYSRPALIWQICPLTLYWIGRAWMVVSRDEMHDDPLVWAVKDQLSRWVAIAALGILLLAR